MLVNDLFNSNHPENKGWWLSELNSLGVNVEIIKELNDTQLLSNITENIKQALFEEYKLSTTVFCMTV
jgi:hypothetical protein